MKQKQIIQITDDMSIRDLVEYANELTSKGWNIEVKKVRFADGTEEWFWFADATFEERVM